MSNQSLPDSDDPRDKIQELFNQAFDSEKLDVFCFEHFPGVYDQFASETTYLRKIEMLLLHCEGTKSFGRLLAQFRVLRPDKVTELFQYIQLLDQPSNLPKPVSTAAPPTSPPLWTEPKQPLDRRDRPHSAGEGDFKGDFIRTGDVISADNRRHRRAIFLFVITILAFTGFFLGRVSVQRATSATPTTIALLPPPLLSSEVTATPPTTTPASTYTPTAAPECYYEPGSDKEAISHIIQAEAKAANTEDISVLEAIFAEDAIISRGDTENQWHGATSYYSARFADLDFRGVTHTGLQPVYPGITETVAYYVSGKEGDIRVDDGGWISFSHPIPSNHWTLRKNHSGCWVIAEARFNDFEMQ